MNYSVNESPERCLALAEAHMISLGYNTETKTDTSLTVAKQYQPDKSLTCLMYIAALFTLGAALLLLLVVTQLKVRVTLAAIVTTSGTSLTVGGADQGAQELSAFIEQNLK